MGITNKSSRRLPSAWVLALVALLLLPAGAVGWQLISTGSAAASKLAVVSSQPDAAGNEDPLGKGPVTAGGERHVRPPLTTPGPADSGTGGTRRANVDVPHEPDDPASFAERASTEVATELRDASWAPATESMLVEKAVALAKLDVSIEKVTCGSTRCAIEGTGAEGASLANIIREFSSVEGLRKGHMQTLNLDDGGFSYQAIVARTGFGVDGAPLEPAPSTAL